MNGSLNRELVLLVALIGAAVLFTTQRSAEREDGDAPLVDAGRVVGPAAPDAGAPPPVGGRVTPAAAVASGGGEHAPVGVLHGRVALAGGAPPAALDVHWVAGCAPLAPLREVDWAAWERARRVARTDARGRFSFTERPALDAGAPSFLLVVEAGLVGGPLRVPPGARELTLDCAAHESVPVRVVAAPEEGAVPAPFTSSIVLAADKSAPCALWRARGALPRLAGRAQVRATHAGRVASWCGDPAEVEGELVLAFAEPRALAGVVRDYAPRADSGPVRVLVRAAGAPLGESPLVCDVAGDGGFELGDAHLAAERWTVRLEGGGGVPQERTVVAPPAGGRLVVDFDWRPGLAHVVRVVDEERERLAGVRLACFWQADGGWAELHAVSDGRGEARYPALPPGPTWYRAYAEGYARRAHGPRDLPWPEEVPLTLVLEAAGGVRGRVTEAGEVARAFTIHWYDRDHPHLGSQTFKTDDGRFELNGLPVGALTLCASTATCPTGAPRLVQVEQGRSAELELEVPPSVLAAGLVIDHATGAPVAGASARTWIVGGRPLEAWGAPAVSDDRGRFAGLAVSPVDNSIGVTADGYAPAYRGTGPLEPGENDVGVFALERYRPLRVQLGGDVDFAGFELRAQDEPRLPAVRFDARGRAGYPEVDSSLRSIEVHPTDFFGRIDLSLDLQAGRDWTFDVPMDVGRTVEVELLPELGAELPEDLWVMAEYATAQGVGVRVFRQVDAASGSARFRELPPAAVEVAVYAAGELVAVRMTELTMAGDELLQVELGGRPRSLVFVDRSGAPLDKLALWFAPTGAAYGEVVDTTDATGVVALPPLAAASIDVFARSHDPRLFWAGVLPLEHGDSDGQRLSIEVDPRASLDVRLVEHGRAAVGVAVDLVHAESGRKAFRLTSGRDGRLPPARLAAGAYAVRIRQPGWWPDERRFEARDPARRGDVLEVRRTASVRFEVSSAGAPLANARLELVHEDRGSAAEWLADGRVTGALVTDEAGAAALDGLPSGAYTYRVRVGGAVLTAGTLEARPHASTTQRVSM
jgi:hypothetical protein